MKKINVDLVALRSVISYIEDYERKHYESYDRKPKNHIWLSIKRLKDSIKN